MTILLYFGNDLFPVALLCAASVVEPVLDKFEECKLCLLVKACYALGNAL